MLSCCHLLNPEAYLDGFEATNQIASLKNEKKRSKVIAYMAYIWLTSIHYFSPVLRCQVHDPGSHVFRHRLSGRIKAWRISMARVLGGW